MTYYFVQSSRLWRVTTSASRTWVTVSAARQAPRVRCRPLARLAPCAWNVWLRRWPSHPRTCRRPRGRGVGPPGQCYTTPPYTSGNTTNAAHSQAYCPPAHRQKALTTGYWHTQLDPFASKLAYCFSCCWFPFHGFWFDLASFVMMHWCH